MTIDVSRFQTIVERYMLDTVRIESIGEQAIDPVTLQMARPRTTVYEGPAMVSPLGDPALTTVGGKQVYRTQCEVGTPAGTPQAQENNEITIIASRFNPNLVDTVLFVHGPINGTYYTHNRTKAYLDRPAT